MTMQIRRAALGLAIILLQAAIGTAQAPTSLNSRGPLTNPAGNAVLAEVTAIPAGLHTFRAVLSVAGILGAPAIAAVLEWRDQRGMPKWQQGFVVPQNTTIVVPFEEAHSFSDGDTLRLIVFTSASGTVWGTVSVSR